MKSTDIIKAIWLQSKTKAPDEVWENMHDADMYKKAKEMTKEVESFDDQYASITAVEEGFVKIGDRFTNLTPSAYVAPMLYRWNKSVVDFRTRFLNLYDHMVFVLDDNGSRYHYPEGMLAIYFSVDISTGKFVLADETREVLLLTDSISELIWFAAASCKYLLVGSKTEGGVGFPLDGEKTRILNLFLDLQGENECRVMAFPGQRGCFANKCLKKYPGLVSFIDSWDDVFKKIENDRAAALAKKEEGDKDE